MPYILLAILAGAFIAKLANSDKDKLKSELAETEERLKREKASAPKGSATRKRLQELEEERDKIAARLEALEAGLRARESTIPEQTDKDQPSEQTEEEPESAAPPAAESDGDPNIPTE